MTSPELAAHDRRRVAMAIKAELAQIAGDRFHGALPDGEVNPATVMERSAPSVEDAVALGEPTPRSCSEA